jgi:dolichol-phosphate mannosyltransferase
MDGDLQNPPAAIPRIYAELVSSGADVVYTVSRVRNGWIDGCMSWLFWFTLERILKVRMIKHQLMMRGMTRRFADFFKTYGESTRVVAGIMSDMGFEHRVLEVENRRRPGGRSHYRFFSRVALMIDLVLALSNRPLDALINLGALGVLIATVASGYHLYMFFVRDVPPGFTSLILSIAFFGSANMMILGIIGRYLSNIYREARGRPLYFVQKTITG